MRKLLLVSLGLLFVGCTPPPLTGDGGIVQRPRDAGDVDTGTQPDADSNAGPDGGHDAGFVDAGLVDAGFVDAGILDAGLLDAGDDHAGTADAGAPGSSDAGTADAGETDAGETDAGETDAGETDAGETDAGTGDAGVPPDEAVLLRIVAANLSSGNYQSYDPGHGQRILEGLAPDVVLIQELNYDDNTPSDVRAFVDDTFGPGFDYYREEAAQIPNGVISRYPIVEAGVWDDPEVNNREFAWARIDVPGDRDLWAISVHLLTRNASTRNQEAQALVAYVNTHVPDDDLLVIGGDLNTDSATEPAFTTLAAVVSLAHTPVDQDGVAGTNASRSKPYDWVMPDLDLEAFHVPVVIGAQSFPSGLVFDSRVYTPLSDVAPVQPGDSAAPSMQHMAVVRDFALVP